MNPSARHLFADLLFTAALCCVPALAVADDIDIFTGSSAGTSSAPNVMFLLDNTPNWSNQSQHWPDNNASQGEAEVAAITSVMQTLQSASNVGLAMLTTGNVNGGYIRYGARDMTVPANLTALTNILRTINANIGGSLEKISGQSQKDETAALFELYRYFTGGNVYAGGYASGTPSANADFTNNFGYNSAYGTAPNKGSTPYGQGLRSGFALNSAGTRYNSPLSAGSCGGSGGFIIYIANNAGQIGSTAQSYAGVSAGAPLPNLAIDSGTGYWTNEWTRFLSQNGVTTYILDAYNAQQNVAYSQGLINAAKLGGGRYYRVSSQVEIVLALKQIFSEIASVNATFTSASLPVNATNRSQDQNQVFIGSFRPAPNARPRWPGNLKQYQLIQNGNSIDLGDSLGRPAVVSTTGYISDCAVSFWTTDTSAAGPAVPGIPYWSDVPVLPSPRSACAVPPTNTVPALPAGLSAPSPYSDWPDGSDVGKGGVAEVIRRGNAPPLTQNLPTWLVNRSLLTLSGSSIVGFNILTSGLSLTLVDWISGKDNNNSLISPGPEKLSDTALNARPLLHGDVIHSRPLPLNYGSSTGVVVYYGANDGLFRAVDGATGRERWAFVAPEFFGKFQRLFDDSPQVSYPGFPTNITPTPTAKDYFFDGETGAYQNADNSRVWIYPSMRRGGRMVYALDVTAPAAPAFKWKFGCPNLANDTGCTSGASGIGQTWSTPVAAIVRGYSATNPVVIVGGGYDACEDANTATPSCTSPKGAIVYVLDANTGAVIRSFTTTRSVAANVAVMTTHNDGTVDYAYIADTGGNIYRLDFDDAAGNPAISANWTLHRVAYTNGGNRKFLFAPSLLPTYTYRNAYVTIGSGDREHPLLSQYAYTTPVNNRFYTFLDDLTTVSRPAVNLDNTNSTSSFYMSDYSSNNCTTDAGCEALAVLPSAAGASPKRVGWFIDLPGTGEQVVTSSVIAGGFVAFSTNRPLSAEAGTCGSALGEARGYLVNLFNASGEIGTTASIGGSRSTIFAGGGLPPAPVLVTTLINGIQQTVLIGAAQKTGGSSSAIAPQKVVPTIIAKRRLMYWKSSGDNN